MIKTLKNVKLNDKEKLKQMRFVQNCIPIEQVFEDGIFQVQSQKKLKKFSATYRINDISYITASDENKRKFFFDWSAVLNALDPGSTNKLNVIKRKIKAGALNSFLMHSDNPLYQDLQKEYNKILIHQASQGSGMIQEVYLTISVNKKDITAARNYFTRVTTSLQGRLLKMSSSCEMLSCEERLELLHDIYRGDSEAEPPFNMEEALKKGSSAKNYIAPDSMEFETDYFKIGDKYGRALVLHDYPTYLRDSIVTELCDVNQSLIWAMDIIPMPTDEAVREAEARATSVEANIARWFQKQYNNKNYGVTNPPYDMEQQRAQTREYLNDLTERDQHLMYAVVTMVHFADSKEQLDDDTDSLKTTARTAQCKMTLLRWQQLDGLNTALPLGLRRIEDIMTLTTEGVAGFMPFRSTEVQDKGGFSYGQNQISKNMILINPQDQQSPNSVILGMPGSGKSMFAKWVALNKILSTAEEQQEIVIIDPEREYSKIVQALGGEVIYLSATSQTHINAMDVSTGYDSSDNPLVDKTEFMLSLCEQLMYPTSLGPKEKSLIGRCTEIVLGDYVRSGCKGEPPTLIDFHKCMLEQPEPEAQDIALSLELYCTGALSVFANQTNTNIKNRIVCFDILDLGDNLMSIGMLILCDHIQNRMIHNRSKGILTSFIYDEFYLLLQKRFTAEFFYKLWKRCRKYGADNTGITQNVSELLDSEYGRLIVSTSEIIVMLNQAPLNRETLTDLLEINENQQDYIRDSDKGTGLIKVRGSLIPFDNTIPKTSKIYELLTTKPNEKLPRYQD